MITNKANIFNNLITLEMANNHMGNLNHGKIMIDKFSEVIKKYENKFNFAWKFQFRDIPTFIHPNYINRMDIKYVKRFTETNLTEDQFRTLKEYAQSKGFITMCTAFDENSIDRMLKIGFDIAKVASCSSTDWPLLDKLIKINMPMIISTAGTTLEDIDNIVSFFQHKGQREKINNNFAIMHCVGEYPTDIKNLELNQIDLLKQRYKGVNIGFSTHEHPKDYQAVKLAVAKGVTMFEKHVAVDTKQYPKNGYSATPEDVHGWLEAMVQAYQMCGIVGKRYSFSVKEIGDLRQFRRGVFAKKSIKVGENIDSSNIFYAWPNQNEQLLSIDMSKFTKHTAQKTFEINDPIFQSQIASQDKRTALWNIVNDIKNLLNHSGVVFPGKADLEISHHYGIENFYKIGLTMITVVNREYCKKLLISLPGQKHPEQYHKKKEETFIVLYGDVQLKLNGKLRKLSKGDVVTIESEVRHEFATQTGCIIEEVSSTHYINDSFYTDETIGKNKNRKTYLTQWTDGDLLKADNHT